LKDSLDALKQIIDAQRAYIRAVEHERDLFAEAYWGAVKKCDELESRAYDEAKQSQLKQDE